MTSRIGEFAGPIGDSRYWRLPNRGYEWDGGYSLGPYTFGPQHQHTTLGESINRYKYWNLEDAERAEIVEDLANRLLGVLWEVFPQARPFGVCLAVPGNRGSQFSLPRDMCEKLTARYDWLVDGSAAIERSPRLESLKTIPKKDRAEYVSGAWTINKKLLPRSVARAGILVIDDVYDTGATMREMSRTIRRAFQREPKHYMVALSHVETKDWNQL